MPHYISIFRKFPEDYLNPRWMKPQDNLCADQMKPGHIRVQFRWELPTTPESQFMLEAKDMLEHDFPLELNGDLDLRQVGRFWGFERCKIFDVDRREVLELANPYCLSAIAIRLLTEHHRHITICEYTTNMTKQRKDARSEYRRYLKEFQDWENYRAAVELVSIVYFLWYVIWYKGPIRFFSEFHHDVVAVAWLLGRL